MEELKLVPFADPKLKSTPSLFDFEKENAEEISERLFIAMRQTGGVGLSANQVGLDMKVFVMGGSSGIPEKVIINPLLLNVSDEVVTMREGCLSYPGLWLTITRPAGCILKYKDEKGNETVEEFKGIPARIVLHEYDHMVGQNFTMRASRFKIQRAMKSLDKKVKNYYRHKKTA
jgi:peptide deformylase